MRKNIGIADFWIRGLLGLELFMLSLFVLGGFTDPAGRLTLLIASLLMITALNEYSPIYDILRISTRERPKDP